MLERHPHILFQELENNFISRFDYLAKSGSEQEKLRITRIIFFKNLRIKEFMIIHE